MRHIKAYKIFENIEELDDLFGSLLIDTKTYTFPFDRHDKVNLYVVYGTRIEHDDHELLKELYNYRSILREIYNKEYFHIIMTESQVIMILFDYKDKFNMKNGQLVSHIRSSYLSCILPYEVYQIIKKDESSWRGYGALQSGIRYTNGDSSNLALYDWQYGQGSKL